MTAAALQSRKITDARDFGRVAVLCGGDSGEREVSLESGAAVADALRRRDVDAARWDPSEQGTTELLSAGFDRVWNALHGTRGEDGVVQGALDWARVPHTGSGVLASALAMDKLRSKRLFLQADLPTPAYHLIRSSGDAARAATDFGYPLVVKPANQGSSIGMSKVAEVADLEPAVQTALEYDDVVLVERCVIGDEITVGVLQGATLPSIRIETPRVFYDYRAKYESDNTLYRCPGVDDADVESRYAELALKAFDLLGCSGWGRVDFMHAPGDEPQVLEVNTVPGMTSHSLLPMAAEAAGIGFDELCWRVLETSFHAEAADERGQRR